MNGESFWDKIGKRRKLPRLNDLLKERGSWVRVIFRDDGKLISKDVIEAALKAKGVKGIRADDMVVFTVEEENSGKLYSFWLRFRNISALKQLKEIRSRNNDSLEGVRIEISRVSTARDRPNWEFIELPKIEKVEDRRRRSR